MKGKVLAVDGTAVFVEVPGLAGTRYRTQSWMEAKSLEPVAANAPDKKAPARRRRAG
jgi:hypothetical protein